MVVKQLYGETRIPSRLNSQVKQHYIAVLKDGLTVEYIGKSRYCNAGSIQSDICAPTNCPLYYYEVEILSSDSQPKIVVGFSHSNYHLNKHPGSEPNSFGYKSEDGTRMNGGSKTESYGSSYGKGDVIGCGIDYIKQSYFCTKNGSLIGEAGQLHHVDNFPTVGLNSSDDTVKFNFSGPFKFDIEEYFRETLTAEREEINKIDVSEKSLKTAVHLYLLHRGYSKTLEAFKREADVSIDKQDEVNEQSEMEDEKERQEFIPSIHISNDVIGTLESTLGTRSELQRQTLEGDSKVVLERLMAEFPEIKRTSLAYAMLITQHFVELLKSGGDTVESITWLKEFINEHIAASEDPETFFNDEHVKQLLKETCGLLAYKDYETSPLKGCLDFKRRLDTSTVVNDAILSHKNANLSSLKTLLQYLVLGRKLLREVNGNTGPLYSSHDLCMPLQPTKQ